jgi:hypothetical protein
MSTLPKPTKSIRKKRNKSTLKTPAKKKKNTKKPTCVVLLAESNLISSASILEVTSASMALRDKESSFVRKM